jgi:hypothetical protein
MYKTFHAHNHDTVHCKRNQNDVINKRRVSLDHLIIVGTRLEECALTM